MQKKLKALLKQTHPQIWWSKKREKKLKPLLKQTHPQIWWSKNRPELKKHPSYPMDKQLSQLLTSLLVRLAWTYMFVKDGQRTTRMKLIKEQKDEVDEATLVLEEKM